nr:uncharacterized protein LOC120963555 [Aegilops tauschii subsp. strangulata]
MDADEVDGHKQDQMEEKGNDVGRGHADDSDESDEEENVEELLHTLQQRNLGTYVDIQDLFMPELPTVRVLQCLFFSFGVCIEAFRHCRPMICVDGTFHTGKYKGQILIAIGQDGQNQVVPLAFSFVESENIESWTWFFRQLKISVVKEKPNVCILHDRHAELAMEYNLICDRLNVCTQRHVRDRGAARDAAVRAHVEAVVAQLATGTATVEEPVALCDLPVFDPLGTRRRVRRSIKTFQQWIEHEPLERWSLLHDTHGARYGVMTTNLAETYNFVLRGNRALPLTAIVEGIFYGTVKYFRVRCQKAEQHIFNNPNTRYCERVMKYMDEKMQKS